MLRLMAVALAGGLSLAGAAHAQNATISGKDCVYTALIPDYEAVARAYLGEDLSDADINDIDQVIESAKQVCARRFNFTPEQVEIVAEVGVLASTADFLSHQLLAKGASDAQIDGIVEIYDSLSDAEFDAFYDPDWRENGEFLALLRSKVTQAGISDSGTQEVAFGLLEIVMLMDEAGYMFDQEVASGSGQAKP